MKIAWMALLLTACSTVSVSHDAPIKRKSLGQFSPSFYWIASEKAGLPLTRQLYDTSGSLIANVSERFYVEVKMEGTGKLLDGRLVNVSGASSFIVPKDAPWGYGVKNIALRPYRSLAVDPTVIPIGTELYLPQADGMILPDGTRHDGIFYAHDVGSMIKGKRIDIFCGIEDGMSLFGKAGIIHAKVLEVLVRE